MRKFHLLAAALCLSLCAGAESIDVKSFRHSGPFIVMKPFMVDSLNVYSKAFDISGFLDSPLSKAGLETSEAASGEELPAGQGEYSLNWASFSFRNSGYTKAKIVVDGLKDYRVFIDGKQSEGEQKLSPAVHDVDIKYLLKDGEKPSLKVSIETGEDGKITLDNGGKHFYGMKDVLLGTRFSGVGISPEGDYLITSYTTTMEGGSSSRISKIAEAATGKVVAETRDRISWMPVSNRYYVTRKGPSTSRLVAVDPATGAEEVLVEDLPEGWFRFAPSEDYLVFSMTQEGPEEKPGVYQILTPDDRQPGWRKRSYVAKYDLKTGVMQQISFGYHNSFISDISTDGKYALLWVSQERLEKRPTTVSSIYLMNMQTLDAELLVEKDGFIQNALFSPDCRQILLTGSPEALGGIGSNVKPGQTPSMIDMQLFIMDLKSRKIRPMTKDFNPCVQSVEWSGMDGNIYFTAENRDCISFYRLNPGNGKITRIETNEDLVKDFSISGTKPIMAYYGQGAMNSDRLYLLDLKSGKSELKEDLSVEILKDVELGECREWNFKNSKGETVYGRYYLPPRFDSTKKYPMIVNYYGGCSPTSRNFESRYPHHAYAALGYVVYVVAVPGGATGNGQGWSARHVNTAGDGPAQDIIEGTRKFCEEHSFVNGKKVGCIGASYGGFMSQYIPTLTDFFACAVSHAGISDHTSYWGFGYWGYSYSETSMANSYPWSDQDLFVKQSPLYRADRINTPILFVHGDSDTNVPFNESVQMFTALKLLGKETALVAVKDQDHHILDYQKRLEWQDTIWAWFAKWLQDDSTWWDDLYSPKNL